MSACLCRQACNPCGRPPGALDQKHPASSSMPDVFVFHIFHSAAAVSASDALPAAEAFLTDQPVIHLLIFFRRNIPGEVNCHASVYDLVPFALLIVINLFCIADCSQHLM